ncbi:MFS transporter [Horticoccus sp. 23ND18S-11]|uniref:MFS transporter n=1 Tax=Horticoccus sp. 23ND18S-11 TaxID=3391832 RepID=UPI0039C9BFFB
MNERPWFTQTRWRIAGFLALAAALNYADRAAISAVLPALRTSFALSDVQLGLLGSMFLWCYAIASPVAGVLADRWSRRRQVVWSLALWSAVTALMGAADGFLALLLLRGALGLVESLYLPAATALLADHHGPETRGRAMSLHSVGLNFGVVLGGAFAGYLAERFGWRSGFWVLGLAGIGLAIASGFFLRDGPQWENVTAAPIRAVRPSLGEALRYLAGVPSYHVLLAKAMLAGVGVWVFLNWLPLYFREAFNLTLGAAGFAGTFMLQISTVLGIAIGGWVSDRAAAGGAKRRMLVQGLSYLAAAPFLLLFLTHPGFTAVTVAVSAFSLFRGLGQANENPTLCEVIPVQYRSTAIGIMNTCATAAGGVGVLLAGILKRSLGLDAIFAGISLLFVIAGLALVVTYRRWVERDLQRARTHAA